MANNIISLELCMAAESATKGERRTWSPEQYREYAAKLDRLVEAVEDLFRFVREKHNIPSGQEFACPYFIQLHAALREIELTKEPK